MTVRKSRKIVEIKPVGGCLKLFLLGNPEHTFGFEVGLPQDVEPVGNGQSKQHDLEYRTYLKNI